MKPRLVLKYKDEIVPYMMQHFGYKNKLQVPRLVKIVINMGVGQGGHDIKILEAAANDLAMITGQKPLITRAKKAIANFKIREGLPIGCKVTLRGIMMYEFLDRLINVALPRIKDFRGVSNKSFDEKGNYALGVTEQLIFPEVDYDKVQKVQGMDIIINIKSDSKNPKKASYELLKAFRMPFKSTD